MHGRQIGELVVGVTTVHAEIIGSATASINRDHAGVVAAVKKIGTSLRLHTWLQLQQLIGVAPRQRQLAHGALIHHRPQLRGGCIYQWRSTGNLDYIGRATDLQRKINGHDFIEVDQDSFSGVFLETLAGGVQFICAHGHFQEDVLAVDAGLHISRGVRLFIYQRDVGSDDGTAAGIHHGAADAPAGALSIGKWRSQKNRENQSDRGKNGAPIQRGKSPKQGFAFHELTSGHQDASRGSHLSWLLRP